MSLAEEGASERRPGNIDSPAWKAVSGSLAGVQEMA